MARKLGSLLIILLVVIMLGQGVAVRVLEKMGLDLETVRAAVEFVLGLQAGTGEIYWAQGPTGVLPEALLTEFEG